VIPFGVRRQTGILSTHMKHRQSPPIRQDIGKFPPGSDRLTAQTQTGPTICRACMMGAEGFEPPTPSV
jgi:hypothetical protein